MMIEVEDFDTAFEWIKEVEDNMPSLLRRFGMSDAGKLIEELVDFVAEAKGGMVHKDRLSMEATRKAKTVGEAEAAVAFLLSTRRLRKIDDLVQVY